MPFVSAGGHRLEYERIDVGGHDRPTLVLLHEGLGSIAMWRDFPHLLAHATASRLIVYSRYGYGSSDPLQEPRNVRYMHDEALVVLPELLDALSIVNPILVGHSDGGSIALIHAAGARPVMGIVAMSPHVLVEEISIDSIARARDAYIKKAKMRQRLARYHADVDGAFWGWNDIWLHPDFRAWDIEECLGPIECPILAIQGQDDEYGTMSQLNQIERGAPDVRLLKLEDCRHSPHRDQPEAVLEAIARFVDRVTVA